MRNKRQAWGFSVPAAMAAIVLAAFLASCADGFHFEPDLFRYQASVDLDRDYDWYATQAGSGPEANSNCGPASAAMAVRYETGRAAAVEEMRRLIPDKAGWWNLADVRKALARRGVRSETSVALHQAQLFHELTEGRLLIVVLDMSRVTREMDGATTGRDRFYDGVTGHFMVIKGYTEDGMWFIAHDPNTWAGDYYPDGSPKGRNRLYNAAEVVDAMQDWNGAFLKI